MAKAKNTDKLVVQNAAKTLLANIRFASVDDPIRTIPLPPRFPTRASLRFPLTLLRQLPRVAKSVLLVEADMRRRSPFRYARRSFARRTLCGSFRADLH